MSLSKKEAEVIQAGIEGAMQEAKDAKQEAVQLRIDGTETINRLSEQVRLLGEALQKKNQAQDEPTAPLGVCPHCGKHIYGGS